MIFLSRHRAQLLASLLLACLSFASHAETPAPAAAASAVKSPTAAATRQLPSISVAVSQQPPGVSADAATSAAASASKPAAAPTAAKPAVPAPTTTGPTKPAVAAASSAAAPAKPAVITKPAVAAGGAPALGVISEAERRALAAMPLPKLPTLVPRETPATSIAAAAAAEAALPPAPAPSTKPSAAVESPTATEIRSLLSKANERTGLDDVQLARIAQFQATAARGEQETALVGLLRLNDELDAAYNSYNVGHGESLWQIAAKPETYGNANLWPLIWRANPRALPQPRQVKNGQKLRVPRYPSLTAVTEALDYAASHPVEKQ